MAITLTDEEVAVVEQGESALLVQPADQDVVVTTTETSVAVGSIDEIILLDELVENIHLTVEDLVDVLLVTEQVVGAAIAVTDDAISLSVLEQNVVLEVQELGAPGPPGPDGALSLRVKKLPVETPDGLISTFTVSENYTALTLVVTLNGLEEVVVEAPPNHFTFSAPPLINDLILLRYRVA